MNSQTDTKQILVLANNDYAEAMRAAAGLTIFGHGVVIVFVDRIVEETPENIEQAELLELCDIEPLSLVDDPNIAGIDSSRLLELIEQSHHIINI
ncbi:MAG: hypothetical protein ACI845_003562 [Gammaproteobacteria bacterium]|jgi:hypothetical protein